MWQYVIKYKRRNLLDNLKSDTFYRFKYLPTEKDLFMKSDETKMCDSTLINVHFFDCACHVLNILKKTSTKIVVQYLI